VDYYRNYLYNWPDISNQCNFGGDAAEGKGEEEDGIGDGIIC
jgi:hypothetical protein